MNEYEVGDRVMAKRRITENGAEGGDPNAVFPAPTYIHAEVGEPGTVETISDDQPTVRFDRTGTATVVDPDEEIERYIPTPSFRRDLAALLNRHCKENGSNTPDFLLAKYLHRCLDLYDETTQQRDAWYGVEMRPGGGVRVLDDAERLYRNMLHRFKGRDLRAGLAEEICAVQPMQQAGEALAMLDKLLGDAGPDAALTITMGKTTAENDDEPQT